MWQLEHNQRQHAQAIAKHTEDLTTNGNLLTKADTTFRENLAQFQECQAVVLDLQIKVAQLEAVIARGQPVAQTPGPEGSQGNCFHWLHASTGIAVVCTNHLWTAWG